MFHIGHRLAEGMAWHFLFMWFFAINGMLYVLYTALSGEWRYLLPNRHSFKEAIQVTLHDLHLTKYHPPRRKFNGAQQIAYSSIVVMGAGSLANGAGDLQADPVRLADGSCRRLPDGAIHSLLADDGLLRLLSWFMSGRS